MAKLGQNFVFSKIVDLDIADYFAFLALHYFAFLA